MTASKTQLPVVGVPVRSAALNGLDSLLSIVQMPAGVPVATMAIGNAANAALFAARILALDDAGLARRLRERTAAAAAAVRREARCGVPTPTRLDRRSGVRARRRMGLARTALSTTVMRVMRIINSTFGGFARTFRAWSQPGKGSIWSVRRDRPSRRDA